MASTAWVAVFLLTTGAFSEYSIPTLHSTVMLAASVFENSSFLIVHTHSLTIIQQINTANTVELTSCCLELPINPPGLSIRPVVLSAVLVFDGSQLLGPYVYQLSDDVPLFR